MNIEQVYQSLLVFASGIAPSGVAVVEGESYGVRYLPPTAQIPSIAVTVEDVTEANIELGSFGSAYFISMHITAQSRKQRDAMKSIVYSGLVHTMIPIYSSFSSNGVVASGATIERYAEIGSAVTTRDVLDFQSNREKFFWSANVFCGLNILG